MPIPFRQDHQAWARHCAAAALVLAAFTAVGGPMDPELARNASAGSPGLGDRLYPKLGNGGYDVRSYDISLDYRRGHRPLRATTRVDAVATEDLSGFDLDFAHGRVREVRVDGRRARFRRSGGELVVTPEKAVPRGHTMRVEVRHTSDPAGGNAVGGWVTTGDGLAMANQPGSAHRVFPCNDHPADKAVFTFHVTAPKKLTVAANGSLTGRHPTDGGRRTTWTYRMAHPMATELTQVAIGDLAVERRTGPHGLALRDVVSRGDTGTLKPLLARTAGQISWMERRVGRYPFRVYGILSADATTGFELETQTLSLFERQLLLFPEGQTGPLMVHELAHQWFGDSVSPATWSDLWLSEGHATWYEWGYGARDNGEDGESMAEQARSAYAADQATRDSAGPPAAPRPPGSSDKMGIFRDNVYAGGALTLYALRQRVGAPAFERLERAWVRRHRDANASTADFIALASEISGHDQRAFLHGWLYGRRTPPMPGHSDWATGSSSSPATAPSAGHGSAASAGDGSAAGPGGVGERSGKTR
jgi:aminopeptidase N